MQNFDEFMNRAAAAAQTAAAATKRGLSKAKLSISIAAEEDKIKTAYTAIGQRYFEDVQSGAEPDGPFYQEQLRRIRQAADRIAEYKAQRQVAPEEDVTIYADIVK